MKKIVKRINDFLRRYPKFRNSIILIIRYIQYFIATVKRMIQRKKDGFFTSGRRLTPANENCYFGYYDKSPYSLDGKYLIYHSIPAMAPPGFMEAANIYIQNLEDDSRRCLGSTLAWNLQQGAMLRFFGEGQAAWNDFRDGEYCTVVHNLEDNAEKIIGFPLYDVDSSYRYGLSLEFERLNVDAEGYGYIQKGLKEFESPATIYLVDIKENKQKVIINSAKLNEKYPIPHEGVSFFYFNHLNFNPAGNRFMFIERYVYQKQRYSRLFSANIDGSDIRLLASEQMVSHFTWIDNANIMVFCRHNGKDAYYCFEDVEDHAFNEIKDTKLCVDGHPTFSSIRKRLFISDTYPDHGRRRHLFSYDTEKGIYKELAALKAPLRYDGPVRCDFHPRFKPGCKSVCIDSIHEGYRGIYEVDL